MSRYCAAVCHPAMYTSTIMPSVTMTVVPAASPSIPSVMFTALDIPAIMSTAMMMNSTRGSSISDGLIVPPCTYAACSGTLSTWARSLSMPGVSPLLYTKYPTSSPSPS